MTSDHLTPETRRSPIDADFVRRAGADARIGLGFGLGFAVRTHAGTQSVAGLGR